MKKDPEIIHRPEGMTDEAWAKLLEEKGLKEMTLEEFQAAVIKARTVQQAGGNRKTRRAAKKQKT